MRSLRRALLPGWVAGALLGCRATTTAPSPPAGASASASAVASGSAPAASASASAASAASGAGGRAGDGCWGPELPADAEARLALIGRRCVVGMTARLPAGQVLALRDGAAQMELPAATSGGCVRALVVGDGTVSGELVDARGARLSGDRGAGFALVDPGGPVCARAGQALTLRVGGQGESVRVQVWSAP